MGELWGISEFSGFTSPVDNLLDREEPCTLEEVSTHQADMV